MKFSVKSRKDWRDRLRKGDVILSHCDTQRVVRSASYLDDGRLNAVSLTIRKCSWTGRALTTVLRSDLKGRGFRPPIARVRLKTKLDREIDKEARDHRCRKLTCCDVYGIS